MIGLPLRQVLLAKVHLSFNKHPNLERINGPNYRYQQCVHEEHDTLFFYNPVVMRIEIAISNGFDEQRHKRSGEEHT